MVRRALDFGSREQALKLARLPLALVALDLADTV
jgi:hypothetical protein